MKPFLFLYLLFASFTALVAQEKTVLRDSIWVDGVARSFWYKVPTKDLSSGSLVFVLHGSGGSGEAMMKRAGSLMDVSDQEGFLVVYPNGYLNFWNECRKAAKSKANEININEEDYFKGMIDFFKTKYRIDANKVFVVGTSGGGHMAYKLALTMPSKIRAITAIIANLPDTNNIDCPELKQPMHVMIVNGTDDTVNPYEGGEVILGSGNFGHVRSTDRTFLYWSQLAGYSEAPSKSLLPDTDPRDGKIIEAYRHTGRKKQVVLYKVIGGKHDYPNDVDVHMEAWKFFKSTL